VHNLGYVITSTSPLPEVS